MKRFLGIFLFALALSGVSAQTYNLVNSPTYEGGSCFSLVNGGSDATAVWGDYGLYLPSFQGQPLNAQLSLFFGNNDAGGHGLAFVAQQEGMSAIGHGGSGLGYGGNSGDRILQSFAVEFDTYTDAWDGTSADHIAININGDEQANDFGPADLPNIEDGNYHDMVINWNYNATTPALSELAVYFDGLLYLNAKFDPASVFVPGKPIFLGITSGVDGLATNNQTVSIGAPNDPGTCATLLLPVEYLFFKGEQTGSEVRLDWATTSELNNHYFEVERSADGGIWESLSQVNGQGTSFLGSSYAFSDKTPRPGKNYYRLRQVDFDGTFSYSDQIEVELAATSGFGLTAFPNPSNEAITVRLTNLFKGVEANLEISDLAGRKVFSRELNAAGAYTDLKVDISTWQNGLYVIQATSGTNVETFRLVVGK